MLKYNEIFNTYSLDGCAFKLLDRSVTFPDNRNLDIYSSIYVAEDTPWTILSYRVYGTIEYWWVLSSLNRGTGKPGEERSFVFHAPAGTQCHFVKKEKLKDLLNIIQQN